MAVRGARTPRDEPRRTARDNTSSETPPVVASRPPDYDTVRLALDQALPAATKAADPYMVTFALIGLAKAQNAAGDRDSALKMFAEADRMAGTVADQHLRRLALMRTAVARGQLGAEAYRSIAAPPGSIGRCLGRARLGHPARGSHGQGLRAHRHHGRDRRTPAGGPCARNTQPMTAPRDRGPGHASAALRMLRRCF